MSKIKRWLTKKSNIISLIILAALITGLLGYSLTRDNKDTVRVFVLEGVISETGSSYSGISPRNVRSKLDSADRAGAVVLRINSPGGSVVASQEILDIIRRFKAETQIPIVASLGETAASGGYYIALGGDMIVASPGSLTGSIGVIIQFIYLEGLYNKLGIETEIVKSGEHKGAGVYTLSEEEKEIMQRLSDNIYNQFVREVIMARDIHYEEARSLATGEPFSGEEAMMLGLVDETGSLYYAVDIAASLAGIEDPRVKYSYPSSSPFGALLGMLVKLETTINNLITPGLRAVW